MKKLFQKLLLVFLAASMITGCSNSVITQDSPAEEYNTTSTTSLSLQEVDSQITPLQEGIPETTALQPLEVHFIDVGQGDAILLTCNGQSMLIDAGGNDMGTKVQNYLIKQGVSKLDYVVSTHADEDHCGGLDVILYKFDCTQVFISSYKKDTNTYRDVLDTIATKRYQPTTPTVGSSYPLGDATFTIVGADTNASTSNDSSIALLITHGEKKFLFTGDCEIGAESKILASGISIDCDVFKAGHHGSKTASSITLLQSATPTYCVISCSENNSYGHPHAETLNNLRSLGVQVFRTDEQGSIIATSDGTNITWNCAPSNTWKAGEPTGSSVEHSNSVADTNVTTQPVPEKAITTPEESVSSPSTTYICNKNTKKFHVPSCSSVDQMKESNKLTVTSTREEVIAQGYDPCKRCNP